MTQPSDIPEITFPECITAYQERMKKFIPIATRAKIRVFDILQSDASAVEKNIMDTTLPNMLTGSLWWYADAILEASVDDFIIGENGCVTIGGIDLLEPWKDKELSHQQELILTALSLFESLKNPPHKTPDREYNKWTINQKKEFIKQDKEKLAFWMEKKEKLEQVLTELEAMNTSQNGTAIPEYLREIK